MPYDFHVHDAIRVEYRVRTEGTAFPRGWSLIEHETRSPGGNGVICAVVLARWGASVLLTGNAIGDDSHGQFLRTELNKIPNLTFEPDVQAGFATPYALLLKAGDKDVAAMLSPTAAPLTIAKRPKNGETARFFWGDGSAWGESGETKLAPFSQDYQTLTTNLDGAALVYLSMMAPQMKESARSLFLRELAEIYHMRFGGIETIPTLEELEAKLNGER